MRGAEAKIKPWSTEISPCSRVYKREEIDQFATVSRIADSAAVVVAVCKPDAAVAVTEVPFVQPYFSISAFVRDVSLMAMPAASIRIFPV